MIISRTPFRVSFFGGGTDYPAWFREHGGAVLGTTIDKYCYISLRRLPPVFDHKHKLIYSKIELVNELEEIQHPAIKGVLSEFKVTQGLSIHHDGDLPARTGLGSSSAFTVGLINALQALDGKMSSAKYLAEEAIRIEQDVIKEHVGSQDQVWAAFGGTNRIDFLPDGTFTVTPLIMPLERRKELNAHIMLFFTGFTRIASQIAQEKIANMPNRERHLRIIRQMVDEGMSQIISPHGDIRQIGKLLNEGWMLKRELATNVSTSEVDEIYQAGIEAGALGGKLLGAGGGGFIMFFVEPHKQEAVRARLRNLVHVNVEIGSPGSTIVVYDPNDAA